MKKIKKIYPCLFICVAVLFLVIPFNAFIGTYASTNEVVVQEITETDIGKTEAKTLQKNNIRPSQSYLAKKEILSTENMYNLDDTADYLYVEYKGGGYAVYAKETMEMMEYSLDGKLPYENVGVKKYYGGPTNYFQKKDKQFVSAVDGARVDIDQSEVTAFSKKTREVLIENRIKINKLKKLNSHDSKSILRRNSLSSSAPKEDNKYIIPRGQNGALIPNYQYFLANPIIGENGKGPYGNGNKGTCGPIAAQLLLGYHNYYNDRRIIADRFINGFDDERNCVLDKEQNPNYCSDPMEMTEFTTGTRSEDTGKNSFYSEIITTIMKQNTEGSLPINVATGMRQYLRGVGRFNFDIGHTMGGLSGLLAVNPSDIKYEIDRGRPIIISMLKILGGSNHFVVGYGYEDYTYPNGEGTYSGYVVHYGYTADSKNYNNIWINSSWCNGYVNMKINHTHEYVDMGQIGNTKRREYKCSECGQRTDSAINMLISDRYIERIVDIPKNIYNEVHPAYKDFYVTFKAGGNKLIQTFGKKDVKLFLYDDEYNLLISNDDSGEGLNALISHNVEANKAYFLRVQFHHSYDFGFVKLGITPASEPYSEYGNIWNESNDFIEYNFTMKHDSTRVFTFTPKNSGYHTINTRYAGERTDTYMYLIDPTSTEECFYNDDGAGDLQAQLKADLKYGRTYFIIVSPYSLLASPIKERLVALKVKHDVYGYDKDAAAGHPFSACGGSCAYHQWR